MFTYSHAMVLNALREACAQFVMTRDIVIKELRYIEAKEKYIVLLGDAAERIVRKETINRFIESIGSDGAREIAAQLSTPIELEKSMTERESGPVIDEYWDGNMADVNDYLNKKERDAQRKNRKNI